MNAPVTPATVTIGGPLWRACTTCGSPIGRRCRVAGPSHRRGRRKTASTDAARGPHAARIKLAPPEQTVHEGDLVHVSTNGGGHSGRHLLGLVVQIGEHVTLRLWQPGRGEFARQRLFTTASIVALAPGTDDRVAPARAYLESAPS